MTRQLKRREEKRECVTVYAVVLVREKSNGTDDRREDRLRIQGGADRRLCGG